jgi:ferredoxin
MVVESETEAIRAARRTALELIVSDHAGDCVAPCQRADPQHADIPRFLAQVAGGDVEGAAETLAAAGLRLDDSEKIAATAAEKACRRARYEETVDIGGLIRFVASQVERVPEGAADPEPYRRFSVRLGKLDETEIATMLAAGSSQGHVTPADPERGYDAAEAQAEAERCLSCGCAVSESCRLRYWSEHLGVRPTTYQGEHRHFAQDRSHPEIIHEPGKCISCGLCIQAAERAGESLGLAFSGRGFDMRLVAPFGVPLAEALKISALECAAVCPTGALAPRPARPMEV